MTVVASTEQPTLEQSDEPPMKKQKVEGGAAVATASADNTESFTEDVKKTAGRPKKRKRSRSKKKKLKIPCHEMPQFKDQDYQCILYMFLREKKGVKNPNLVYKTEEDIAIKIPCYKFYVSTCNMDGIIGKGRGYTKRKSRQKACLHLLQKQDLVPKKHWVDTMAVTLPSPRAKKVEKPKPIIEYSSYLLGNFRGALEAYLRKNDPGNKIVLKFEIVNPGNEQEWASTCTAVKGSHKGYASHKFKKKSIQLAYLSCMLDMELLSKEEHLEKHPPAVLKEEVEEKSQDSSESSKIQPSSAAIEELGEKNKALGVSPTVQPAPAVNQDPAGNKECAVQSSKMDEETNVDVIEKQNVDEPTKKMEGETEVTQVQSSEAAKEEKIVIEKQNVDEPTKNMEGETEVTQVQSSEAAKEEKIVIEKQNVDEVSKMKVETEL